MFFFSSRRRHTRCLSDWSSDVCSSDLKRGPSTGFGLALLAVRSDARGLAFVRRSKRVSSSRSSHRSLLSRRSEERRVGKECGSRLSRDHEGEQKKGSEVGAIGRGVWLG